MNIDIDKLVELTLTYSATGDSMDRQAITDLLTKSSDRTVAQLERRVSQLERRTVTRTSDRQTDKEHAPLYDQDALDDALGDAEDLIQLRTAAGELLRQIDINDFVDSNGHALKNFKAVHDLLRVAAT